MAGGIRTVVGKVMFQAGLGTILLANSALGQATTSAPAQVPKTPRPKRERDLIESGFVLLGLVMLLCFVLILAVFTVGRRTRRVAGGALPGAAPLDPLWFLKGHKSDKAGAEQSPGSAHRDASDSE